jgi:hypothetical protein
MLVFLLLGVASAYQYCPRTDETYLDPCGQTQCMCSGRGSFLNGACLCDEGYTGSSCEFAYSTDSCNFGASMTTPSVTPRPFINACTCSRDSGQLPHNANVTNYAQFPPQACYTADQLGPVRWESEEHGYVKRSHISDLFALFADSNPLEPEFYFFLRKTNTTGDVYTIHNAWHPTQTLDATGHLTRFPTSTPTEFTLLSMSTATSSGTKIAAMREGRYLQIQAGFLYTTSNVSLATRFIFSFAGQSTYEPDNDFSGNTEINGVNIAGVTSLLACGTFCKAHSRVCKAFDFRTNGECRLFSTSDTGPTPNSGYTAVKIDLAVAEVAYGPLGTYSEPTHNFTVGPIYLSPINVPTLEPSNRQDYALNSDMSFGLRGAIGTDKWILERTSPFAREFYLRLAYSGLVLDHDLDLVPYDDLYNTNVTWVIPDNCDPAGEICGVGSHDIPAPQFGYDFPLCRSSDLYCLYVAPDFSIVLRNFSQFVNGSTAQVDYQPYLFAIEYDGPDDTSYNPGSAVVEENCYFNSRTFYGTHMSQDECYSRCVATDCWHFGYQPCHEGECTQPGYCYIGTVPPEDLVCDDGGDQARWLAHRTYITAQFAATLQDEDKPTGDPGSGANQTTYDVHRVIYWNQVATTGSVDYKGVSLVANGRVVNNSGLLLDLQTTAYTGDLAVSDRWNLIADADRAGVYAIFSAFNGYSVIHVESTAANATLVDINYERPSLFRYNGSVFESYDFPGWYLAMDASRVYLRYKNPMAWSLVPTTIINGNCKIGWLGSTCDYALTGPFNIYQDGQILEFTDNSLQFFYFQYHSLRNVAILAATGVEGQTPDAAAVLSADATSKEITVTAAPSNISTALFDIGHFTYLPQNLGAQGAAVDFSWVYDSRYSFSPQEPVQDPQVLMINGATNYLISQSMIADSDNPYAIALDATATSALVRTPFPVVDQYQCATWCFIATMDQGCLFSSTRYNGSIPTCFMWQYEPSPANPIVVAQEVRWTRHRQFTEEQYDMITHISDEDRPVSGFRSLYIERQDGAGPGISLQMIGIGAIGNRAPAPTTNYPASFRLAVARDWHSKRPATCEGYLTYGQCGCTGVDGEAISNPCSPSDNALCCTMEVDSDDVGCWRFSHVPTSCTHSFITTPRYIDGTGTGDWLEYYSQVNDYFPLCCDYAYCKLLSSDDFVETFTGTYPALNDS